MSDVQNLESKVRAFINMERKHAVLRKNAALFSMCCSALDVIGDTEMALETYMTASPAEHDSSSRDTGNLYIMIYGILQVLYVQQDAVKNLAKSLAIPYKHSDAIRQVRNVRNAAVGHPTHHEHTTPHEFHHISRITMYRSGFQMVTHRADGSSGTTNVDVPALIDKQRKEMATVLLDILNSLREEEMNHRRKFRDDKLASLFPTFLGHTHEKISEAIPKADMREFGAGMLKSVSECVDKFAAALKERGIDDDGFMSHRLGELEHAIARLRGYFTRDDSGLSPEDARVFHFFIRGKLEQLARVAGDIDREYAKDV